MLSFEYSPPILCINNFRGELLMSDINVCLPEEIKETIITSFLDKSLVPVLGSGFSCGLSAKNGIVPSGTKYSEHMINALVNCGQFNTNEIDEIRKCTFSQLCGYYEDPEYISYDERYQYLKDNFYKTYFPDSDIRKSLLEIDWPYIYSLNIDDAIEGTRTFDTVIQPNHKLRNEIFNEEKCLIKLHGDITELVKYPDSGKVFTQKEYVQSLISNAPLLNKLKNDLAYQNVIFIGCSLDDEIDLKFLSSIPIDYSAKENMSRSIFFMRGKPGRLQMSNLKQYGIS